MPGGLPRRGQCPGLTRSSSAWQSTATHGGRLAGEVRGLIDSGVPPEDLIYYGLEYKYVTEYVMGRTSRDEMFRLLETAIHQFAKRQMTWFRGMERRGTRIEWVDARLPMERKVGRVIELWEERKRCVSNK